MIIGDWMEEKNDSLTNHNTPFGSQPIDTRLENVLIVGAFLKRGVCTYVCAFKMGFFAIILC